MYNEPIKLFSASAGSGKTYTLTIEYLKLALKEVESRGYFRRILAVTFTNKAAEEMKRRIVEFLYLIAKNEFFKKNSSLKLKQSNELVDRILSDFKNDKLFITKSELIQRANQTLKQILQDYGLFSVLTIDSFVQKLSQSFIEELNLPDQFEVNLDAKSLLSDLVDEILDQINQFPDSQIKQAIIDFSLGEVEEDKSWNGLRESLQQFLLILFEENYLEKEKLITQFEISDFIKIENQIIEFEKENVELLKQKALMVINLVEQNSLVPSDFIQGSRGPVADFYKFCDSPQLNGAPYGYMKSAIQSGKWEAAKLPEITKQRIQSISSNLSEFASDFFEVYQFASRKNALLKLIKKNLRKFALINHIQKELNRFQLENGIISISEFSKRINQIVSNDPIPFIYEKLGERYHHILIDEFQDTSILQWKNFMPLLENSTSYNHMNLIVGDAKQSIYKFRGGEVGLIASLFSRDISFIDKRIDKESYDFQRFEEIISNVSPENLKDNYRSSHEIVVFNNSLYEWLHQNDLKDKFSLIDQVYGNHLIQTPKSDIINRSTISCQFYNVSLENKFKQEEEKKWNLDRVIQIIEKSIINNFNYKDIAILTRGNREANYLAIELKKLGIPLTSSDSLLLYYSPSIRFILSFIKAKIDSNSRLREFELRFNYLSLCNTLNLHNLNSNNINFELLKNDFPLLEFIKQIIAAYELMKVELEIPYLLKFLDILEEYVNTKSNTLSDFLNYFELNKNTFSINGNNELDAISISTIHKSKGLEYPVVILGFANWSLNPLKGNKWLDFSEISDLNELQVNNKFLSTHYLPLKSKNYEGFNSLEEQLVQEEQLSTLESLNMLYVATTRPKFDLYILSKHVQEDAETRIVSDYDGSVSKLIYNYCKQSNAFVTEKEDCIEYVFSSPKDLNVVQNKYSTNQLKTIKAYRKTEDAIKLRHNRNFEEQFSDSIEKRDFGTMIHDLIAKNDINVLLKKLEFIQNQKNDDSIKSIIQLLTNTNNRYLFEMNKVILNEQEIITKDGVMYRPDRISKMNDTYYLIDYKTGKPSEKHIEQVESYKSLMNELGYIPCKGKLVYFEEGRVADV